MKKEQLLEATHEMVKAFTTVEDAGKIETMLTVLRGMGYSGDRVERAINFLQANLTAEEMNNYMERQCYVDYMNAIDKVEKIMSMAQGYQEMGDINLGISQDSFQAEEEGEKKVYEMVAEKSESDTKEG
jgi:hypothetical protein